MPSEAERPFRASGRRDIVSRRNRRHGPCDAIQTTECIAGEEIPASGRTSNDTGRYAHHRRDNHDLRDYVRRNKFREDLYYRLNVLSIYLPPLRERKEDILPIAGYFIETLNRRYRKKVQGIDEEAASAMVDYAWPGNVRELGNTIERIMIVDSPDVITLKNLPREILEGSVTERRLGIDEVGLPDSGVDIKELTRVMQTKLIKQALLRAKGNRTEAARLLNLDRFSLRYLMNKYKLTG
jgi:transcriptional regulator with PAS, ATPase and Fis domain